MDDNQELETFNFKEWIGDVEHDYRITMHDNYYSVERDGIFIAELQYQEKWVQTDGVPLPLEHIENIGRKIESRYD